MAGTARGRRRREVIENFLFANLDLILWLTGSFLAVGVIFAALWYKLKQDAPDCDCVPTILRNQDGGYSTKTFHMRLCRLRRDKGETK